MVNMVGYVILPEMLFYIEKRINYEFHRQCLLKNFPWTDNNLICEAHTFGSINNPSLWTARFYRACMG
jgi:hypothetical protein